MTCTGCDCCNGEVQFDFNKRVRMKFRDRRIRHFGGLLHLRELDHMIGLSGILKECLHDPRRHTGKIRHGFVTMTLNSIHRRIAGKPDITDTEEMAHDPVAPLVSGGKSDAVKGPSKSQIGRHESKDLASPENLSGLYRTNHELVKMMLDQAEIDGYLILDMDGTDCPVHGDQESAEYNGYYKHKVYHALMLTDHRGNQMGGALRPGKVSSSHGWRDVLIPVLDEAKARGIKVFFRGDSAFGSGELFDVLDEYNVHYAVRFRSNSVLQKMLPASHLSPPSNIHASINEQEFLSERSYRMKTDKTLYKEGQY